jgi:hypothetical protein
LRAQGADLDARRIEAGHELTPADAAAAQDWLKRTPQVEIPDLDASDRLTDRLP